MILTLIPTFRASRPSARSGGGTAEGASPHALSGKNAPASLHRARHQGIRGLGKSGRPIHPSNQKNCPRGTIEMALDGN